jgi:tetratricopeptide (TPR) repeat protein
VTKKAVLRRLLFVFLIFSALAACAPKGKKPQHAKAPPGSHQAPIGIQGEEESPERSASNALIDQGETSFHRGLYDQAASSFQEAVTVDAANGAGYYWLALTKLRSGEYGEAEGLIEKAATLLSNRPEWSEKLEILQREFQQNKPKD